jgi:hypothetical protein
MQQAVAKVLDHLDPYADELKTLMSERFQLWTLNAMPLHSTVTLLARLRGLSTSQPRSTAIW